VAAGAAGRDAALNDGGRGNGSVVAVGAAETVCVLHARVRQRILTRPQSTGKKRLKRIEPLLLVL